MIAIVIALAVSCSKMSTSFRQASLWTWPSDKNAKSTMNIPRKCNCTYHVEENVVEKKYLYKDSSFIFIRNGNPGEIPQEAIKKYGSSLPMRFTYMKDTFSISGVDESGTHWELRNENYFMFGYKRVPTSRKSLFDSALNSISIQLMSKDSKEKPEVYFIPGSVINGYYEVKCKRF
jgi:hypothetical protein